MPLQVSVRPQREGDAIFTLEDESIVGQGTAAVYSDNHVWHTVAAASPDAKLSFSNMGGIRGARNVLFSVEQDVPRAVIHGMDFRYGDETVQEGIIFQIT